MFEVNRALNHLFCLDELKANVNDDEMMSSSSRTRSNRRRRRRSEDDEDEKKERRAGGRVSRWRAEWTSRSVELKSLEDVWWTVVVTLMQLACMWRALERTRKYANESWQPFERPLAQLILYTGCLVTSVCLLPVMIWTGLMRVGVYANDHFKFGFDLDTKRIVEREFIRSSPLRISKCQKRPVEDRRPKSMSFLSTSNVGSGLKRYNSSCAAIDSFVVVESSVSSESASSPAPVPAPVAINMNKYEYFSDTASSSGTSGLSPSGRLRRRVYHQQRNHAVHTERCSMFGRLKAFMSLRTFMPVSSLIHLFIALCLLFPNVLLVSKQIQYGLRPKGNIHHTELDFVFSRPLQRFSETSESERTLLSTSADDRTSPLVGIKYKLISALLEDNDEIKYEPQVSLELVNFFVAALSFAAHYATPLWHLNKLFALALSAHAVLGLGLLTVVSFAAFEVLVKFQTVFAHGIRLANVNGSLVPALVPADVKLLNAAALLDLPFLTTPLTLSIVFLLSFALFLISSMPIYAFALNKYKVKYERIRNSFLAIIESNRLLSNAGMKVSGVDPMLANSSDEQFSNFGSKFANIFQLFFVN